MAQNTRGQNSPPSYIDGISVKISERYKPPKRISLALSYSQILTLNKLIQDPFPTYDFSLEESIKNRVHEWRKARTTLAEERKQRLQTLSQERNTKKWNQTEPSDATEVLTNKSNSDSDTTTSDISNNKDSITEAPHAYYSTESGVLIPMTFATQQQQPVSRPVYQIKNSFNFSEFESDTSSPFDNMELKTINDLEELAEVLKRDSDNSTINSSSVVHDSNSSQKENNFISNPSVSENIYSFNNSSIKNEPSKENHINGYYYNNSSIFTSKLMYGPSYVTDLSSYVADSPTTQARDPSVRSVTEIMKSLEEQLAHNHISEVTPIIKKLPVRKPSEDSLEDPYNNLTADLQQMAVAISSMGFPLARVARACQALEGNQKKVVEHLLAISDLLDLGFPEQKVVDALLKCNNDRDKALDLLIT